MKRIILALSLSVFLILSACAAQNVQPTPNSEPTKVNVPTNDLPADVKTATNIPPTSIPDTLSVNLDSIKAGLIYSSFWLTYDISAWNPIDYSNDRKKLELINSPGCILGENAGMGAPENWKMGTSQESIGIYNFRVEEWTDTTTGKKVLITFNSDSDNLYISIVPGSDVSKCIDAAREVIKYSAESAFGPIQ